MRAFAQRELSCFLLCEQPFFFPLCFFFSLFATDTFHLSLSHPDLVELTQKTIYRTDQEEEDEHGIERERPSGRTVQ